MDKERSNGKNFQRIEIVYQEDKVVVIGNLLFVIQGVVNIENSVLEIEEHVVVNQSCKNKHCTKVLVQENLVDVKI